MSEIHMFMWFVGLIVAIFLAVGIFVFTKLHNSIIDGLAQVNRNITATGDRMVARIAATGDRMVASIAEVKTSITGLETKMEGRIAGLETKMEGRIAGLDGKVDALKDDVSGLREDIGKLQFSVYVTVPPPF
ncbi:MAG: hypothetical protein LBT40_05735 [Deltaproteobacteria bacterium]|jgi:predicted PurR-regulated permease PerM|nr:hypothetical protein [Deltaproteobacteria bacterium]